MYGWGGIDFGGSSTTGELASIADESNASDRSSKMARGGGRSTWASSNCIEPSDSELLQSSRSVEQECSHLNSQLLSSVFAFHFFGT
jgi:hypothetical protein